MKKKYNNKEIVKIIKLFLPAQNHSVNNMLNAILGQAGVNSFEFGKQFEEVSKIYKKNVVLNVKVIIFTDKTFNIHIDMPPVSYMVVEEFCMLNNIKKLPDDSSIKLNALTLSKLYKISFFLFMLRSDLSLKSIVFSLFGSLRSMHCIVINDINKVVSN